MLKHPDIVMESLHSLTGASWNRKLSRNGLRGSQSGSAAILRIRDGPVTDIAVERGRPRNTAPQARTTARTGLPGTRPAWP